MVDRRPFDLPEEHRPQGLYLIDKLDVTGIYGPSIERRYVWLNFDIDMVDIGNSYLSAFKPIASKIKRLKFERENSNEAWFNTEKRELKDFKNVEEIHVVCADGFDQWAFSMYDISWPCADDKYSSSIHLRAKWRMVWNSRGYVDRCYWIGVWNSLA
jgi:hypothetical protein